LFAISRFSFPDSFLGLFVLLIDAAPFSRVVLCSSLRELYCKLEIGNNAYVFMELLLIQLSVKSLFFGIEVYLWSQMVMEQ
jgi:hypothetical protein